MQHGQHIVEQVHPRRRVDHDARLHAVVAYVLDGAVQVRARLVVHADPVGARLAECGDELVGVLDHQVAIQRQFGRLAQRLHHRRPQCDVGHKVAVHHVHMDGRAAAALGCGDCVPQMGEVCRQNGWQQFNHGASVSALESRFQPAAAGTGSAALRATREMARSSNFAGGDPVGSAKMASPVRLVAGR